MGPSLETRFGILRWCEVYQEAIHSAIMPQSRGPEGRASYRYVPRTLRVDLI